MTSSDMVISLYAFAAMTLAPVGITEAKVSFPSLLSKILRAAFNLLTRIENGFA